MKIRLRHLSFVLIGAAFAAVNAFHASAQAQTLDWNSVAWQAGVINQNVAVGGNNALFAFSGNTAQFATVTGAGGAKTPAVGAYATNNTYADGATGRNALQIYADFADTTSAITLIVTFQTPVPFVRFSLFDVDQGTGGGVLGGAPYTFEDQVSAINASADGTNYTLTPTLTSGANTTITGNTAYGSATSTNNTATSNVNVSFANPAGIKSFRITYGNRAADTQANPDAQIIALGNIVVPEPGPVVGVLAGSALLAAWTLRRRQMV